MLTNNVFSNVDVTSHSEPKVPDTNDDDREVSSMNYRINVHQLTSVQEHVRVTFADQKLHASSQIVDYVCRGRGIEDLGFLFYLLDTYEAAAPQDNEKDRPYVVPYLDHHPRSQHRVRIIRQKGHETLPEFIGRWFPRRDVDSLKTLYHASMLLLFKPWRDVAELKGTGFDESFKNLIETCTDRERIIMDNIQYYYDTADRVALDRQQRSVPQELDMDDDSSDGGEGIHTWENHGHNVDNDEDDDEAINWDVIAQRMGCSSAEWKMGEAAVGIGRTVGVFERDDLMSTWTVTPPAARDGVTEEQLKAWSGYTVALIEEGNEASGNSNPRLSQAADEGLDVIHGSLVLSGPVIDSLLPDQKRAFGLIDRHLAAFLRHEEPKQLLMFVLGEGGTGKTKLIEAVTWAFDQRGSTHLLAKTGSTGVAANNISGTTLHHFATLPGINPNSSLVRAASEFTKAKREKDIRDKRYLIGDECGMFTQELVAAVSDIVGTAHAGLDGSNAYLPFGGLLNVIFVGDFHQFPPVMHEQTALYKRVLPNAYAAIGRGIVEQFDKVVILKEQVRITDPIWRGMLSRARMGDCTEEDMSMLKQLVLTNDACDVPDFTTTPWCDVVLVTSRNATRIQWNRLAIRKWCKRHETPLFIIPSRDRVGREKRKPDQRESRFISSRSEKQTGDLTETVEIAQGMPAYVTLRHPREKRLSRGAKGIIEEIVLHPSDHARLEDSTGIVVLRHLPLVIKFRLDKPPRVTLPGLPVGVLPIVPSDVSFTIPAMNGGQQKTVTVHRQQYALVPAFGSTDYKAQGQTLANIVADLGKPGFGSLSQFNAYVALSRSHGRATIRLLREFDVTLSTSSVDRDLLEWGQQMAALDESTIIEINDVSARSMRS